MIHMIHIITLIDGYFVMIKKNINNEK